MTNQVLNPKQLLKKYGIKPSKRLGQNFLVDKNVLKKIINAANLSSKDIILEIGPGLGILTIELAKKVKKVIAVEKSREMYEILKQGLKNYKNVEIINKDILRMWDTWYPTSNIGYSNVGYQVSHIKYKIVANLPYYITSPVIRKFLETENKPELMILMVQKEVAQRICSRPGKMSILSIAVQFYCSSPHQKFGVGTSPQIITYVSKKSFYPQPKVDSAIIKLVPQKIPEVDTEKFFKLIKAGFSSKRKMLINNLSRELKIEACKLKIVFDQIELGQKLRAQDLSVQNWLKVFHRINFV